MPNKQGFGEHLERMQRIHRRIATAGTRFNVPAHAEAEGVSLRQIQFDIALLREWGLPIRTGTPKNPGYYYESLPAWPRPQLTLEEATALVDLLESQESTLTPELSGALRKLRGM